MSIIFYGAFVAFFEKDISTPSFQPLGRLLAHNRSKQLERSFPHQSILRFKIPDGMLSTPTALLIFVTEWNYQFHFRYIFDNVYFVMLASVEVLS